MKISTKSQYGLRAMVYLAKNPDKVCSLKLIAKEENIPFDYLEKIVSKLEKAELVKSKKGSLGGYFLAKPLKEIKLGEIINTLEEKRILVQCAQAQESCVCLNQDICATRNFWKGLQDSLDSIMNSKTLSDLVK